MHTVVDAAVEQNGHNLWYEDQSTEEIEDAFPINEYDFLSSPSDFTVQTWGHFVETGVITIPGFLRRYTWDREQASRFIQSLTIGFPVPQIFLYESGRNKFLVVDGQQRVLTMYFFIKERFPKKEKIAEIQYIFHEHGYFPSQFFENDDFFDPFTLYLPEYSNKKRNDFLAHTYSELDLDVRTTFEGRSVRAVILRQVDPETNTMLIHEIFHRLNGDETNPNAQEIRMSLHHSDFYTMLTRINRAEAWRRLVGIPEPDACLKDLEFLLRGFAMLVNSQEYGSSMAQFLNAFSKQARAFDLSTVYYLESLFHSFLASCAKLPDNVLWTTTNRFSITLFESLFVAVCCTPYEHKTLVSGTIVPESVNRLKSDREFLAVAERTTSSKANVLERLQRAQEIIHVQ